MSKHVLCFILCILLSTTFAQNLAATTVSVQVVQIDKSKADVTDTSVLIEETVLDYFFSHGLIVSTSPIITDSSASKTGYAIALNDAKSGSIDYLVYISVFFDTKESNSPQASLLQNINSAQWQIIRTNDNKQTASGKHVPKIKTELDNTTDGIINFGRQIAASINSSLRKR